MDPELTRVSTVLDGRWPCSEQAFSLLMLATGVAAVGAITLPGTAAHDAAPPGATAQCRDGTYSFSQHHSGTCSHHGGVARWLDGGAGTTTASSAPTAPHVAVGRTVLLAPRTRTSGCKLGPNPDRRCSPGAYSSGLTKAVLCSSTFRTGTIRNVPLSEKHAVEVEYGMAPGSYGSTLEIDHIISLELGGSNDIANLFPEKADAHPGYHVKDKLENKLHQLVCAGTMSLHAAQVGIATNWQRLYLRDFGVAPVERTGRATRDAATGSVAGCGTRPGRLRFVPK